MTVHLCICVPVLLCVCDCAHHPPSPRTSVAGLPVHPLYAPTGQQLTAPQQADRSLYCIIQYTTEQYCSVLYCQCMHLLVNNSQHLSRQTGHSTVLYSTLQNNTVVYCTVNACTYWSTTSAGSLPAPQQVTEINWFFGSIGTQ